ncbi:MAG TPA: hypothetical protein VJT31_03320 [Rugosimonospora sp.]|nr:hypothetical protein [Rugosimonospora sp.]
MATSGGGRYRTAPGIAALVALILVLAFGNPSYARFADQQNGRTVGGYFLQQLAWPRWTFSSSDSVRTLLANDLKALLLVILAAVFASLLVSSQLARERAHVSQFFAGWGSYIFAGAFAGLIAAWLQVHASLFGALMWASGGATYGLFVGWIMGLALFGARR